MPEVQGLGRARQALIWTLAAMTRHSKGNSHGQTKSRFWPVRRPRTWRSTLRDYERFTQLFKWGAIVCLIIGLIVLLILR